MCFDNCPSLTRLFSLLVHATHGFKPARTWVYKSKTLLSFVKKLNLRFTRSKLSSTLLASKPSKNDVPGLDVRSRSSRCRCRHHSPVRRQTPGVKIVQLYLNLFVTDGTKLANVWKTFPVANVVKHI
jgi:hypothetical protein